MSVGTHWYFERSLARTKCWMGVSRDFPRIVHPSASSQFADSRISSRVTCTINAVPSSLGIGETRLGWVTLGTSLSLRMMRLEGHMQTRRLLDWLACCRDPHLLVQGGRRREGEGGQGGP